MLCPNIWHRGGQRNGGTFSANVACLMASVASDVACSSVWQGWGSRPVEGRWTGGRCGISAKWTVVRYCCWREISSGGGESWVLHMMEGPWRRPSICASVLFGD